MAIPLIPVAVVGLGGLAFWRVRRMKYGVMTPKRKKLFEAALKDMKDGVKLRKMADAFDKVGLKKEALELRKRAALREAPQELTAKRAETVRRAMSSKDPQKVRNVAQAFYKIGAYTTAKKLSDYAKSITRVSAHGDVDCASVED
jgi:hypothetical protein